MLYEVITLVRRHLPITRFDVDGLRYELVDVTRHRYPRWDVDSQRRRIDTRVVVDRLRGERNVFVRRVGKRHGLSLHPDTEPFVGEIESRV